LLGLANTLTINKIQRRISDLLTKNFIEFRTREELYDLSKDPGCRTNLSNHDDHQTTLKDFRNRMKQVLQKTNDHELDNYLTFLNKK